MRGKMDAIECPECGREQLPGGPETARHMRRNPAYRLCMDCGPVGVTFHPDDITDDGIPDDMVVASLDEAGLEDFLPTEREPEYGREAISDDAGENRAKIVSHSAE